MVEQRTENPWVGGSSPLLDIMFYTQLNIKSFDIIRLEKLSNLILAGTNDINIKGPFRLPVKIKKVTVLKSPHVHKKAREQFEIRTHHRLFTIKSLHANTILQFLNNLQNQLPIGIQLKTKKIEIKGL